MSKSPMTIGMLAHVDAGKTTLIEALLYQAGAIKKPGRVDKGDEFLDTDQIERRRGITIYAQEARLSYQDTEIILVDTPGHADFASEMERTLPVLDMAVLLIDARDGVTAHTHLLWSLLTRYEIPTFIFVNKMDLPGPEKEEILQDLSQNLEANLVDFTLPEEQVMEEIAMKEDQLLAAYLKQGKLELPQIRQSILSGQIHPVFFGSALYQKGVADLLSALVRYQPEIAWPADFACRVYKISHDGQKRVQARILGGELKTKDSLGGEKIHQIRLYSADRYKTVAKAEAGQLVSLLGPVSIKAGQTFGPIQSKKPLLQPVLPYSVTTEGDFSDLLQAFQDLNDEFPELNLTVYPGEERLTIRVMGPIFLEVLEEKLTQTGLSPHFQLEEPLYQESLASHALGIGHFEPKGHYAEVKLFMESRPRNSGLSFVNDLPPDQAEEAQVRAVEQALLNGKIPGVLIGSPLTDICFHLRGLAAAPISHHADFQEAARRAVRQGLMSAESLILEPLCQLDLRASLPSSGRLLQDLDRMGIEHVDSKIQGEAMWISCQGPAAQIYPYLDQLRKNRGGEVRAQAAWSGWGLVKDPETLIAEKSYDPVNDPDFPPYSIFFQHGSSFAVNWADVWSYAHLSRPAAGEAGTGPADMEQNPEAERGRGRAAFASGESLAEAEKRRGKRETDRQKQELLSEEELNRIFKDTFYANANWEKREKGEARRRDRLEKERRKKQKKDAAHSSSPPSSPSSSAASPLSSQSSSPASSQSSSKSSSSAPSKSQPPSSSPSPVIMDYLLVDGYNLCHAWPDLRKLLAVDLDQARELLISILQEYQALSGREIILVFDAYKVKGRAEMSQRGGIHVVYTREAQTADSYIQEASQHLARKCRVTVATSDGLEQLIVWKQGATVLSAREFYEEVREARNRALQQFEKTAPPALLQRLGDNLEDRDAD